MNQEDIQNAVETEQLLPLQSGKNMAVYLDRDEQRIYQKIDKDIWKFYKYDDSDDFNHTIDILERGGYSADNFRYNLSTNILID